jgi:hypothetical protein
MIRNLFLLASLFAVGALSAQGKLTTPGSAKPLFVVNEVIVNDVANIDPNNIESIEVLKTDAATKKYGSQGKDGVVIIKTKRPVQLNYRDPKMTEMWEPKPAKVTPGIGTAPPSDAIVLFDGKNLGEWQSARDGSEARWQVADGAFTVAKGTGDIKTKRTFGDVQLHIEWRAPAVIESEGQGRGNSGIFLQERYELQVLDSYESQTYSNGQAGSIYKQHIPLVNATRAPGDWQAYDVIYTAPKFGENGQLVAPARITVLHNGVLIQNNVAIWGGTEYIGLPKYNAHGKGAIQLQDHGNPVSYRNIWIREL